MKKNLYLLLTIGICITYFNKSFSQCAAGLAESCCATTNGTFSFVTNDVQGSCQSGNDMGYVVLNVDQGGSLDVLINGDQTTGFY